MKRPTSLPIVYGGKKQQGRKETNLHRRFTVHNQLVSRFVGKYCKKEKKKKKACCPVKNASPRKKAVVKKFALPKLTPPKGKRQQANIIMQLSQRAGSRCCHTIYHDWHDRLHQPLLFLQSNFQPAQQIQTFRQTREPG